MPADEPDQHRKRRSSDMEVRRAMLDAAHEIVTESGGLGVSLKGVAFDDVWNRAGVSRSTAYRVWSSKDDFKLDVIRDLAGPSWQGTAAFDQETIELASGIVADNLEMLQTAQGRRLIMLEAVRIAAKRNFDAITESAEWRTYVALTATIISAGRENPDFRKELQAALTSSETHFVSLMASFYEDMSIILGFRLKPPHQDFSRLAAMGAAVVEGLALRQIIAPDVVNAPIILDHGDGPKEWSLAALGFLAILDQLVELSPDYDGDAAMRQYLRRLSSKPRA